MIRKDVFEFGLHNQMRQFHIFEVEATWNFLLRMKLGTTEQMTPYISYHVYSILYAMVEIEIQICILEYNIYLYEIFFFLY